MDNKQIGVFDSGIGGLTVLKSLLSVLPKERYIYIGDNLNCPYGDKSVDQLRDYSSKVIDYLLRREVKVIVVACNTTSANVLSSLECIYWQHNVKFIGVIDATCKQLENANAKHVLVIGTQGTITKHTYKNKIEALGKGIIVDELMTPSLVPLIETGKRIEIEQELHNYLDDIIDYYDSLVLGCTHYPIIEDEIRKIARNQLIISSSVGVANEVLTHLNENNLRGNEKDIQIYTTGDVKHFVSHSKDFFDYSNAPVKKISL